MRPMKIRDCQLSISHQFSRITDVIAFLSCVSSPPCACTNPVELRIYCSLFPISEHRFHVTAKTLKQEVLY